eukprot:CAMPEP_0194298618 /NCGR_PEP_ID=MMETSP0169-20130528/60266_1 /TAXON_ID=218684 /ORGANISM="Corethron pennatum, Strain L29A3" /LENGTH=149 /DNA_ID=CAMNT_0039048623 /DNA_START=82 /DNA_END=531 /DNA_ORIENTATION=-
MEVLNSGDAPALVTNSEVRRILQLAENRAPAAQNLMTSDDGTPPDPAARREARAFRQRDWIEERTAAYIDEFVSIGAESAKSLAAALTSKTSFSESDEGGFDLTDAEALQVLNHLPTEIVELHLLIEDLPSRLSEERQQDLLNCIARHK